jgi:WD40 repeat protein
VQLWRVVVREGAEAGQAPLALERLGDRLSGSQARHVTFSPDGRQLAWVEFQANALHVWDLAARRPRPLPLARLLGSAAAVAFLDQDRIVFVSADRVLEVWNLATDQREGVFDPGRFEARHEITLGWKVAVSTDRQWLVVRGSHVTIWDVPGRRYLFALPEERVTAQTLALSPDRSRLAVGSFNGELALWDVPKIQSQLEMIELKWPSEPAGK